MKADLVARREVRACWCPEEIRPIIPKQQVREYTALPDIMRYNIID